MAIPPPPPGFQLVTAAPPAPDDATQATPVPASTGQPEIAQPTNIPPPPTGFQTQAMAGRMAVADNANSAPVTSVDPTTGQPTNGPIDTPLGSPAPAEAPPPPMTSTGGAVARGLRDAVPGVNYLDAGANYLGSKLGLNDTDPNMSYADRVRAIKQNYDNLESGDRAYHSLAHYGAEAGGLLLGGGGLGAAGKLAVGGERAAQIAQLAERSRAARIALASGGGAATGAAYSAGDANPEDAGNAAISGGVAGAALAPVAGAVVGRAGDLLRKGGRKLVDSDNAVINYLASHAQPQGAEDMAAEAARQRDLGFAPTAVDVVNESGRRGIRSAAGAPNGAREAAVDFAADRAQGIDRDVGRAAQPISPVSQPTDVANADLVTQRRALMDNRMSAVRDNPLPMAPDVQDILQTPHGRAAIRNAIEDTRLPDSTRQNLRDLNKWIRNPTPPEFTPSPSQQKLLEGMGPKARQQIHDAMEAQWKAQNPDPTPTYTTGAAEAVRSHMADIADSAFRAGNDKRGGAVNNAMQIIRDHAALHDGAYGEALSEASHLHDLEGGLQAGASIAKGTPDAFAAQMRGVSDQPVNVPSFDEGKVSMSPGPSPLDMARQAARRSIEQEAQTPGSARSIIAKVGRGAGSDQRLSNIVPDATSRQVQEGLDEAGERARRGAYISPNTGSQTHDLGDAATSGVAAAAHVAHAATAPTPLSIAHAARSVGHFVRRFGLNNADAADLVRRVTDPTQTDAIIQELTQRVGSNRRAQQIYNVARRAAVIGAAPMAGGQ